MQQRHVTLDGASVVMQRGWNENEVEGGDGGWMHQELGWRVNWRVAGELLRQRRDIGQPRLPSRH